MFICSYSMLYGIHPWVSNCAHYFNCLSLAARPEALGLRSLLGHSQQDTISVLEGLENACWQATAPLLKSTRCSWASSSAGRAPRSQRGGRGFESPLVHQILKKLTHFRKLNK